MMTLSSGDRFDYGTTNLQDISISSSKVCIGNKSYKCQLINRFPTITPFPLLLSLRAGTPLGLSFPLGDVGLPANPDARPPTPDVESDCWELGSMTVRLGAVNSSVTSLIL